MIAFSLEAFGSKGKRRHWEILFDVSKSSEDENFIVVNEILEFKNYINVNKSSLYKNSIYKLNHQ